MSEAMECGPYTRSEATALSDIQGMLLELDIEKAALRLGLFVSFVAAFVGLVEGWWKKDDYIAEFGRAQEACRVMGEACESDRAEVGRLRIELGEVREELRREREGAEGVDVVTCEEVGDGEQEVGKVEDVQEGLESLALGGGA